MDGHVVVVAVAYNLIIYSIITFVCAGRNVCALSVGTVRAGFLSEVCL